MQGKAPGPAPLFGAVFVLVVRPSSLLLISLLFILQSPALAELIDQVVASVNNSVVTLSELNQAVGFNSAIRGGNSEALRKETLEGLINKRLLLDEAYRLKFVEVSEQDINAELDKLKSRLGSESAFNDFLARLDITPEQLRRMLGERLLVERFVEKKIGLYIRVTREEARDYFTRHPERFPGKRFTEVQKAIEAGLQEQKLEQQLSQYLADLKSRADIRVAQ